MSLLTKQDRLQKRQYHATYLKEKHGAQEATYQDLAIYTYHQNIGGTMRPCLEVFQGTSSKPVVNAWYRSDDSRAQRIATLKESADLAAARKAEHKAQPKRLSQAAQAAALIREELKAAYPTVKFKVTSSNYSMGNSVDVSWDLGPTERQIDRIINKYQYGDFDGMTDSCKYRPGPERTAASAKFVFANRQNPLSEQMAKDYAEAMEIDYTGPEMRVENHDQWLSTMVWQLLSQFDLTNHGYQGIQPTGKLGAGDMSTFYTFTGGEWQDPYA